MGHKRNKKETLKKYQKENPGIMYRNNKRYRDRLRKSVIILLGGKCVRCGFCDERALQIDHINGGGKRELTKKTNTQYLKDVIISTNLREEKYQLLCANCNWIKRFENNETLGQYKKFVL